MRLSKQGGMDPGDFYITIRELPEAERPRERLAKYGAQSLQTHELIAILLRTGTKRRSALTLAQELLQRFDGINGVVAASVSELAQVPGIGLAKAAQLAAAMELSRRATLAQLHDRPQIRGPEDIYALLSDALRQEKREHFVAVLMDTKNKVLKTETISIGTLDSSLVHPREVFRAAIREGAACMIVAHNHPSGDPTPSPEDIQVTKRLQEVGKLVGIELLDHIIVGDGDYTSLRQRGMF